MSRTPITTRNYIEIDPNGVLRVHLGTPDMKCGYVGDLTADPLPLTISPAPVSAPREARSHQGLEGDPRLIPKIAKLSPSDQQQLNKQLSALMRDSRSGPAVDRIQGDATKQSIAALGSVQGNRYECQGRFGSFRARTGGTETTINRGVRQGASWDSVGGNNPGGDGRGKS